MGANGVGIADTLQDGHFPLVVQRLERRHGRVEPDVVIDVQDLLRLDFQHRPVVHIQGVVIGDDGVQGVVGARHLQDHQHRVFFIGCHELLLHEVGF